MGTSTGTVMKILVLKISDQRAKIFMVRQTNFFKNFGPFANIVKIDLWCQLDAYRSLLGAS